MKKFMIWYVVFSILMFVALYTFTLYQGANKRSIEFFNELISETVETKDATEFIKYQAVAYRDVPNVEALEYAISLFQVVVENQSGYEQHLVVVVIPLSEGVSYATSIDDDEDKTRITLNEGEFSRFDSKTSEMYQDSALSYGIHVIGMYYYDILLESSFVGTLTLTDYQGVTILTEEIFVPVVTYTPEMSSFTPGYTQEEKDELLGINDYVKQELITNMTWFIVVDIVIGGIMWFILKKIARKMS